RLYDLAGFARRLADGKRIDMLHAALDLAPDGVLAIQEGRIVSHDEELAVGAVRVLRTRHRGHAALVRLAREFSFQIGQVGPVIAGAGRVAPLRHEAGDHAVKNGTVVKAAVGEVGD